MEKSRAISTPAVEGFADRPSANVSTQTLKSASEVSDASGDPASDRVTLNSDESHTDAKVTVVPGAAYWTAQFAAAYELGIDVSVKLMANIVITFSFIFSCILTGT